MFSKNIKILSIFLILAVVMIGALGAVSAADASVGTANANVTADASNTTSASTVTISGNATTSGTSFSGEATAPADGSALNATVTSTTVASGNSLTVSSNVITDNATKDTSAATTTGAVTIANNGSYTGTITLDNYATTLVNGTTYYIGVTAPANSVAYTGDLGSASYVTINAPSTVYIPFTAVNNVLTLDNNATTITYGDSWSFSGTLTDSTGKGLAGQTVTLRLNSQTMTATTADDGSFKFTSAGWAGARNTALPAAAVNYSATFETTVAPTATANLNVTQKKLNDVLNINTTTANYGEAVNLSAILSFANGTQLNGTTIASTLTASVINAVTGETTTISLARDENTGAYVDTATLKTYAAGTYYITVNANNANADSNYYVNGSNTVILTITQIGTTITADPANLVNSYSKLNATPVTIYVNTTTGDEALADGTWTAVLYKADGTPVGPVTITGTAGKGTIAKTAFDGLSGDYYVVAKYTPKDTTNYASSTTTFNVTLKADNTITSNETIKYAWGTTGNSTIVNITSAPVKDTTLTVYNGKEVVGTVTITNGTGTFNLGALNLPAGTYTFTFAYPGDNTYVSSNDTTTVTVSPESIGTLNTNTSKITVNLTSDNVIGLNLTNTTNASQLINYTGNVQYSVGGTPKGNISMVNGVATVPVTSLTGLSKGDNTVTFQIDNNYSSTVATVIVTANQISTAIVSNNITTNNATPITVTGTVTNATEGTVTITIKKGETVVAILKGVPVAADGSFTASFGTLANGNYTATIAYTSTSGLSKDSTADINVTVNGTAPTPTPVGNITTVLTLNNFTEVVGAGQNLTGTLTDVNGTPIVGQHIALNLTNPRTSASKIYWVTTDTEGAFQLAINLAVGTYTASASYAGNSYDNVNFTAAGPVAGTITVTDNVTPSNKTATVLTAENYVANATGGNFTGILTANGTPLVGQHITLNLTRLSNGMSKLYYATTDTDGAYQLEINLGAGNYTVAVTYDGTSVYDAASANGTIVMTRA